MAISNNDKSHSKLKLQLENLNDAIVHYFNEENPFYITDENGNPKKLTVIYNSGETWHQVEEIEKRQSKGDFALQKPIITIRSVGMDTIKEWNRLPKHFIVLDKQVYKNPNTKERDFVPNKKNQTIASLTGDGFPNSKKAGAIPVYEYTLMRYPTHYKRYYRISTWTEFIEDQDSIIESIMSKILASNTLVIKNDKYNTLGFLTGMSDESNYNNRTEDKREVKNTFDFEFEGYLIHPDSIVKKRTFSHVQITEEIVRN